MRKLKGGGVRFMVDVTKTGGGVVRRFAVLAAHFRGGKK